MWPLALGVRAGETFHQVADTELLGNPTAALLGPNIDFVKEIRLSVWCRGIKFQDAKCAQSLGNIGQVGRCCTAGGSAA